MTRRFHKTTFRRFSLRKNPWIFYICFGAVSVNITSSIERILFTLIGTNWQISKGKRTRHDPIPSSRALISFIKAIQVLILLVICISENYVGKNYILSKTGSLCLVWDSGRREQTHSPRTHLCVAPATSTTRKVVFYFSHGFLKSIKNASAKITNENVIKPSYGWDLPQWLEHLTATAEAAIATVLSLYSEQRNAGKSRLNPSILQRNEI